MTENDLTPMQKAGLAHGLLLDFRQRLRDVMATVEELPSGEQFRGLATDWRAAQAPFEDAWAALVDLPMVDPKKVLVGLNGRPLRDTTSAERLAEAVGRITKLRNELAMEWADVLTARLLRQGQQAEESAGAVAQQKIRDLEQQVADLEEDNDFLRRERGQRQTRSVMTSA